MITNEGIARIIDAVDRWKDAFQAEDADDQEAAKLEVEFIWREEVLKSLQHMEKLLETINLRLAALS